MPQAITTVSVKYVGREEDFEERNYGSGLTFDIGQSRNVPPELADQLLRHADVFTRGDEVKEKRSKKVSEAEDTAEKLAEANEAKRLLDEAEFERYNLIDQINLMNEETLQSYAMTKYGQPLDKELSLGEMRLKVGSMIDQFGAI